MFFRRLNWNVVGWFKTVSAISYAIIIAGALMIAYNLVVHHYPIKLGLSFTGGTDVTVKYKAPTTADAVRAALATVNVTDAQVNTLTKAGDDANERFTISTQVDFGDQTSKIWNALATAGTIDRTQSSIEAVGPSLSHEYLIKALEALVIAIGIQFGYIAFRFGWNYIFGLVTVIALLRDAAMMIGIYALAQKRADDAFLAAVLTVIGYSVMDTIVILDRIRENVRLMPGQSYDAIVNTSILQTMSRSVNTLATVVVTLVALLAFGGASLQNFAFALLVGICSGGYHSIFYSAPLVAVMRDRQLKDAAKKREELRASGGLRAPKSVAEARAQEKDAAERAAILAARRERRSEKKSVPARTTGPARYKRKRVAPPAGTAVAEPEYTEYDEDVLEYGHEEIDPLDAQRAGLHDEQLELGHEEIVLNLEDHPIAQEFAAHEAAVGHDAKSADEHGAAAKPE
jgi:preprotein translocase SecF subunit